MSDLHEKLLGVLRSIDFDYRYLSCCRKTRDLDISDAIWVGFGDIKDAVNQLPLDFRYHRLENFFCHEEILNGSRLRFHLKVSGGTIFPAIYLKTADEVLGSTFPILAMDIMEDRENADMPADREFSLCYSSSTNVADALESSAALFLDAREALRNTSPWDGRGDLHPVYEHPDNDPEEFRLGGQETAALTARFTKIPPAAGIPDADDAEAVRAVLEDGFDESLDVVNAWEALHFTLAGEVPDPEEPLGWIFMGGRETSAYTEGGPVRLYTPAQVKVNAELLSAIDDADFTDRFDPERLDDLLIEPVGWTDGDGAIGDLLSAFNAVKRFYQRAAEEQAGMLLSYL